MDEPDYTTVLGHLESAQTYSGLERLIVAALADPSFAAELIADPATATAHVSPTVQLLPVERALVISITGAADIHDFAARLHARVQQERRATCDWSFVEPAATPIV